MPIVKTYVLGADPVVKIRLSPGFQKSKTNRKKMKSENFPENALKDRCREATCQI